MRPRVAAVTFRMDGVATDLAGSNPAAWKQTFDGFLSAHPDLGGGRPGDVDYLADTDGGTTGRASARGAAAGTFDLVPGAYGVTIRADTAGFEPRVAAGLSAARFTLVVRGQQIAVSLTARRLLVTPSPYVAGPVPVRVFVDAVAQTVEAGQAVDFPIPRPAAAAVDGLRRPAA